MYIPPLQLHSEYTLECVHIYIYTAVAFRVHMGMCPHIYTLQLHFEYTSGCIHIFTIVAIAHWGCTHIYIWARLQWSNTSGILLNTYRPRAKP